MMVLNPKIEIYVLDAAGNIREFFAEFALFVFLIAMLLLTGCEDDATTPRWIKAAILR